MACNAVDLLGVVLHIHVAVTCILRVFLPAMRRGNKVSLVVEIICTLMQRAYFQASARALVSLRSPTEAGCLDR